MRIGVANRYRYDYSVEDEYYEKPMTLLEAVHLPIPVHEGFSHISPDDEYNLPYHYNDVRFNYKPQHMDRRCFIHDNWMNTYNFSHEAGHLLGVMDEDLDWMMGDPLEGMHWKQLRSPIINFLGAFILIAASFIYPLFGLKIPQKDNPFYWRKKYASLGTMHTFQTLAMLEYGAGTQKGPESESSCRVERTVVNVALRRMDVCDEGRNHDRAGRCCIDCSACWLNCFHPARNTL